MHFQTFKKYILPFGEIKQCEHPGDEGKNFCPLCLIDVSVIAIHASGGGGGGGGGGGSIGDRLFHL